MAAHANSTPAPDAERTPLGSELGDHGPKRTDREEGRLESAVEDARGGALLLDLAVKNVTERSGEAWDLFGLAPRQGYHLFLLTAEQVDALTYANALVLQGASRVRAAYFGPELALSE